MAGPPFPKAYWKGYLDVRPVNPLLEPADPNPVFGGPQARDAFARFRVSEPETIFDSKLLHDKSPLFWDEQVTNVSGNASSTFANSSVVMSVEAGDEIVRQSRMRHNYQPGKSQLVLITGQLASGSGVTSRIGLFDASDGLFFQSVDGTYGLVIRRGGVDSVIIRDDWDDPLDGTGPSGLIVDFTKAQIYAIDFEWLGVGQVRFALFAKGLPVIAHEVSNLNVLETPYIDTPNLPIRHEVASTEDSVTSRQICASVSSEGGTQANGVVRAISTGGTAVDAAVDEQVYAVLGVRLKAARLDTTAIVEKLSMINEDSADFEWLLLFNPTVAGTFTYSDLPDSSLQVAVGAAANTIVDDDWEASLASGYSKSANQGGSPVLAEIPNALRLGSLIDGTLDEIVLAVRPLTGNSGTIRGAMTLRELV